MRYNAINLLDRIATQALVDKQIDHNLWCEFMEKMGYPLVDCSPDQLDEARKTWFRAYEHWLTHRK